MWRYHSLKDNVTDASVDEGVAVLVIAVLAATQGGSPNSDWTRALVLEPAGTFGWINVRWMDPT